ncbi:anthranilate phosphoribosyltransferase [candidate division MSBL1 archaeon SCGC-AAA259A05]|uniref:Anthranilate phosphoribosyltransferase n=1 Tax=candidate division MSBL1 archaeon SCGC-AAA259A05 TaxID=1698259 RepID=A0A133U483_9EURY|nr:anthranilate phosphoribosyltransferase [candidate division MSBL1 archaeon SCGC-AAA259A05]
MSVIQSAISRLVENRDLGDSRAEKVMKQIMSGEATPAQIGAFLSALRIKGETPSEIAAFARVMRQFASRIEPEVDDVLVDTCGTGGDQINTFNISTSAMFVAAGAGVLIAKHGNRSVTSKSGSADIMETLGVKIDVSPGRVERTIEDVGLGFMFAPRFHKAMKHAIGPRREVGLRTAFNILGPLTNPAGARVQLMGVYDASLTEKLAKVLRKLDCKRAMVVHGLDGLDEISTLGPTRVSELEGEEIRTYAIEPEDFGISRTRPEEIAGGDAEESARILLRILEGEEGPHRDITLLNGAAAISLSGRANNLEEGLELAKKSVDSGKAYEKLKQLVDATDGDIGRLKELEESL